MGSLGVGHDWSNLATAAAAGIDYKRDTWDYFRGLGSDDETVLYLDDDGGYMTQNSILKKMDVYTFIF